jgi:hypothetical protein
MFGITLPSYEGWILQHLLETHYFFYFLFYIYFYYYYVFIIYFFLSLNMILLWFLIFWF